MSVVYGKKGFRDILDLYITGKRTMDYVPLKLTKPFLVIRHTLELFLQNTITKFETMCQI